MSQIREQFESKYESFVDLKREDKKSIQSKEFRSLEPLDWLLEYPEFELHQLVLVRKHQSTAEEIKRAFNGFAFAMSDLSQDVLTIDFIKELNLVYIDIEEESELVDPFQNKKKSRLEKLVQMYNRNIEGAYSNEDKLMAIVAFIKASIDLQPFKFGNTSTFLICLTNRLLLQNGFPPATFEDLHIFKQSPKEIFQGIKQAISVTQDRMKNSHDKKNIKNDYANKYKKYKILEDQFLEKIKKEIDLKEKINLQDKCLDNKTMSVVMKDYINYKQNLIHITLFGKEFRFFKVGIRKPSKTTEAVIKQLGHETNAVKRYRIAINYITKHPTKPFARILKKAINSPEILETAKAARYSIR